jgi:hypothetical protein
MTRRLTAAESARLQKLGATVTVVPKITPAVTLVPEVAPTNVNHIDLSKIEELLAQYGSNSSAVLEALRGLRVPAPVVTVASAPRVQGWDVDVEDVTYRGNRAIGLKAKFRAVS